VSFDIPIIALRTTTSQAALPLRIIHRRLVNYRAAPAQSRRDQRRGTTLPPIEVGGKPACAQRKPITTLAMYEVQFVPTVPNL